MNKDLKTFKNNKIKMMKYLISNLTQHLKELNNSALSVEDHGAVAWKSVTIQATTNSGVLLCSSHPMLFIEIQSQR